jgi:diguanylate cyclase (GGDEF)-like protein/putative nucleotidyltransferase with HDIG domain
MLAAEIAFHTTMVYFLGGITWLGGFAYVFGLIFANAFLDPKRGLVYTLGVVAAFMSLALLDAGGVIPHYAYRDGSDRAGGRYLFTTVTGGAGVFLSIYAWMNWVGSQLRRERDTALKAHERMLAAQHELQRSNEALEERAAERTRELSAANAALGASESLLRATVESTADGILVVDMQQHVAFQNARFSMMWRIPESVLLTGDDDRLLAFVLDQLVDPEAFLTKVRDLYGSDREDFDTLLFKDGRVFERYTRPLVIGSTLAGRVWAFRDVTARRQAEEILRRQASRDPLTNCLNHAAIGEEMRIMAAQAGGSIAVIMADIDGMKAINDTYGHQAGDAALTAVARALSRDGAVVGRYGGDEFVAVLASLTRPEVERYCQDVMRALESSAVADVATGSQLPVIASMGLAIYPQEAATLDEAIRMADDAMYAEKRERRMNDEQSATRGIVADERASRMIGEIVPLLTSPGHFEAKLRSVAQRLKVGAGYDGVRIHIDGRDARNTSAYHADAVSPMSAYDMVRTDNEANPIRQVLNATRRPILVHDLQADERFTVAERSQLRDAGFRSAAIVPMMWQDEIIGTLSAATHRAGAIDARDVQLLLTVAAQVTAIIRMEALVTDLQSTTGELEDARADTVVLLAAAAEAHEQSTGQHLHRVQAVSTLLARELDYDEASAEAVGLAAILHDIGKIRVPERILLSPERLDGSEWAIMKQHTTWGAEFLAQRPGFETAAVVAACHHERWDGGGYPRGLAGDRIPEVAAIVTVADSFDAITSHRPYREARPAAWAMEEIARCAGTQFSPRVVDALRRLYERGDLTPGQSEQQAAA